MKNKKVTNYLIIVFTLLFCVFCFCFPDIVGKSISRALTICAQRLVPSLFPTLVITSFLSTGSMITKPVKLLSYPLEKLFGIPKYLSGIAFLGLLAGYPTSALALSKMYENKLCSKFSAEYTVAICSNPSFAFIISGVAFSVLKRKQLGIILIVAMLFSVFLTSLIMRKFYYRNFPKFLDFNLQCKEIIPVISRITSAIAESGFLLIKICSFVIFFSGVSEFVVSVISRLIEVNSYIKSLIYGFFEISGGVFSVDTAYPHRALIIICILCGWSGVSVLFQIKEILSKSNLSIMPYIVAKTINCIIFPLIMLLIILLFPFILV